MEPIYDYSHCYNHVVISTCLFCAFCCASAFAADLPTRKSGLWESTVVMSMMNMTHKSKECVDEATDKKMMEKSLNNNAQAENCTVDIDSKANSVSVDISCDKEGMKMNSKTFMTGDFQSSYKGETKMTFVGGPGGMKLPTQTVKHSAKWLGECPDDMKPGDMISANGKKMNIMNM